MFKIFGLFALAACAMAAPRNQSVSEIGNPTSHILLPAKTVHVGEIPSHDLRPPIRDPSGAISVGPVHTTTWIINFNSPKANITATPHKFKPTLVIKPQTLDTSIREQGFVYYAPTSRPETGPPPVSNSR